MMPRMSQPDAAHRLAAHAAGLRFADIPPEAVAKAKVFILDTLGVGIAGQNNEHLEILSKIAILFSEEDDVQKLLDAPDADALYALLGDVNE